MGYTDPSFGPLFYQADQKYGFRPGTTGALAYGESRYNPKAVSPQGAQGLMQLMPDTGRGLGVNNPFDPAQSVDAGARYFKQGLDAEGGDYAKAAMYYHGGPDRSIWGPKTHAYADNFTSRLTSLNQPQPGGQQMPPQMPPQGNPYQQGPQMAPIASLGGLAQPMQSPPQGSVGPNLAAFAQSQVPPGSIPAKSHSKFNVGNIMGVLGDALSAYGGRQPTFGPMLNQEHMMEQQQGFEREKFNQELQMRMYAMTHPEEMLKAEAFQTAPKEVRQSMVDYENTMHPTVAGVQQPNGSVINSVIPRQLQPQVGEIQDGHRFLGGDPANQQSWEAVQ